MGATNTVRKGALQAPSGESKSPVAEATASEENLMRLERELSKVQQETVRDWATVDLYGSWKRPALARNATMARQLEERLLAFGLARPRLEGSGIVVPPRVRFSIGAWLHGISLSFAEAKRKTYCSCGAEAKVLIEYVSRTGVTRGMRPACSDHERHRTMEALRAAKGLPIIRRRRTPKNPTEPAHATVG